MRSTPHDDEDGISDEEKSDSDPEEAYTAVRSVVSIPKQAAEEAQENPKVAELKERLINAYPRLFSGVANKNPPDRGRFGIARIKLKPNPKIYRHREYQLQGDRAEAMKKLLAEFIERGWIEHSDSEWASPEFIVPKKEKGEWRLVVDDRGLNEQTDHDSYSLPLIDTILQKQQKKRIFTVLDLIHGYHQMPLHPDSRPCTAMLTPLGPMQWKVVPMGAKNGNAAFQRMMEDLLGPVRDCADPFVDDIIIGSGTEDMTEDELIEAHEKDLRRIVQRAGQAQHGVQAYQSLTLREGSGVCGSRGWSRATLSHSLGSWRPCTTGRSPRPSANSDTSWGSAITIRAMSGCMRDYRARCTRCCKWASSTAGRGARRSLLGPLRSKMRSTA